MGRIANRQSPIANRQSPIANRQSPITNHQSPITNRRQQMNSREKGKRGEREWRDELRANGYAARRGQQFSGSPDSPDVVCEELDWIHFEVKAVERLNIEDAMEQARRDCGLRIADCGIQKVPVVAHSEVTGGGW